ncbi:MAG: type VI secretion system tip protein VgrG [Holosporales bacterium]|jgi:type VI secretion system secreted protein VgrG|nr:type VI secretion system tip protein VgrG [Holosporales bacterium]
MPPRLPTKQDNLDVKIKCSAISEAVVIKAEIVEAVSNLFKAEVFLQTTKQIDVEKVVNSVASVSLKIDDDTTRYFFGIIESASFENIPSATPSLTDSILYIKIVPTLARTLYSQAYQSFQEKSVKEIIETVLKNNGVSNARIDLRTAGLAKRSFCVQYGESYFHFISRLMEEEGIFFYFECEDGGDVLRISDNSLAAKKIKTELKVAKAATNATIPINFTHNVSFSSSLGRGRVDSFSYNEATAKVINGKADDSSSRVKIGEKEFYDRTFLEKTTGDAVSKILLESDNSVVQKLTGNSYCPELYPGAIFKISGSSTQAHNGEFFTVSVRHFINQIPESDEENTPIYYNSFVGIPSKTPFRPPSIHCKNRIVGCQTAVVTGTSNEEILCDENARIKVKFHWDSRTRKDEKSSCWVRVAQSWAGAKFGSLVIPRVGMEVLVEFVNGDPDQPLVTGCLYNGLNKPPSNYAKEKNTVSTFYTNSSKGGNGFNELRFNDKKDEEEIYVHAQKDVNCVVENSATETLNEGSKTITLESKKNPTTHALIIKKGENTITINEGDYVVTLDKGNQSATLKDGNKTVTLSNGDLKIEVDGGISIKATKDITIESQGAVKINSTKATAIDSRDSVNITAAKDFAASCMKYVCSVKTTWETSCLSMKLTAKTSCEIFALNIKTTAQTTAELSAAAAFIVRSTAMLQLQGTAGVSIQGAVVKLN